MNAFFIQALHQYGYPALWLIVFVAATGAPISGNLLLYAAGALAAFGNFNLFVLFFVGVSAAVMGDNLGYVVGRLAGAPLLDRLENARRSRFISPAAIGRGRAYFRRRAGTAVFITRFLLVVLGGPINLLAGAERFSYRKFLFWDASGQALGALIPLGIGYFFATSWGKASDILGAFSSLVLISLIITTLSAFFLHKRRGKRSVESTRDNQAQTKSKILILISRSGGGHLNLAQALRDELEARFTIVIADPQSSGVERFYTWVSRHWVGFLNWQFTWTDHKIIAWGLQNIVTLMGRKRLNQLLDEVQPQLIIVTHALVSYLAARVNEERKERIPLVFQLTDLERVHLTWFSERHADAYFAPTREIFAQALAQGIAKERLYLTGRPIRRQFSEVEAETREKALIAPGFAPGVFTVFLQGGARGSASADQVIKNILSPGLPVQIILAAGNNRKMAERYAHCEHIQVLPFTEHIAPLMATADVIAGKAGASSISEAFYLEKPFLATAIMQAQEGPSLSFLQRHNLGWACLEASKQRELFAKLIARPDLLIEKIEAIRLYKAWNTQANQKIGLVIDHLLNPKKEEVAEEEIAIDCVSSQ